MAEQESGGGAVRPRSRRGRLALPVVLVVGAVLVAVGVATGVLLTWDPPPPSLEPSAGGDFQVTQQSFDDSRTVSVDVTLGDPESAISPLGGRVTAVSCRPGDTPTSGSSIYAVNGVPLVSLATATPMWRDLSIGDSGADVSAVTEELVRIGAWAGPPSPTLTSSAVTAWRGLATGLGVPAKALPAASIPQSLVVWLPSISLALASCGPQVGAVVAPGQTLATFEAPIVLVSVSSLPAQLAPGARTLVIDQQTKVVPDSSGVVSDQPSLGQIGASPTVRRLQASGQLEALTGQYVLTEPLTVSVVPPSSIVAMNGMTGCVLADGVPRQVTVVSSQLGQSLVEFPGGVDPPQAVALNPPKALTCQ